MAAGEISGSEPILAFASSAIHSLAWPCAIFAIAIVFRKEIVALLPNITAEVKTPGVNLRLAAQQTTKQGGEDVPAIESRTTPLPRENLPSIPQVADIVKQQVSHIEVEERENALIQAVAFERLEKHFALTYVRIFGSQIAFLQSLNERGGSISISDAQSAFNDFQRLHPEFSEWTLDTYVKFLNQSLLIEVRDNSYHITNFGRDFLHFIVKHGLPLQKA